MNLLNVDLKTAILALAARQWPKRKIARELKIDRKTVNRYWPVEESKAAIPPAGSENAEVSNAAISPAGFSASGAGRKSDCEPLRQLIETKLGLGLSAQRIYQDLVTDQVLKVSYDSVKRFVRRLEKIQNLPFRRME